MKDNFDRCLAFVLDFEGGYVNDPSDPGGETIFGISKRAYPDLNIGGLSEADAGEIYRRDYWAAMRCDDLPSGVDLICFDGAVNQGKTFMGKAVQRVVRVPVGGVFGPVTMGAIARSAAETLLRECLLRRQMRYTRLNGWSRYGKGWTRRLMAGAIEATHLHDDHEISED